MREPSVSVILPTLNRADLLSVSAGSVLAQSYSDLELIVVDDGSEEDIDAAVRALDDSRARCIRRSVRGGPAAARNTGLLEARGQYVAFQDSDDIWETSKLEHQMRCLDKSDGKAMSIGALQRTFGESIRSYGYSKEAQSKKIDISEVVARPVAYAQTWLIPTSVLKDLGGFDDKLWINEDWELLLRLAQKLELRTCASSMVYSKRNADSITNDAALWIQTLEYVVEKHSELIDSYRPEKATLYYFWARKLISEERYRESISKLLVSVVCDPLYGRAWAYLMLSSLKTVTEKKQTAWRDI